MPIVGEEEEALGPTNYQDGIQSDSGTPFFMTVSQWLNTSLYLTLTIVVLVAYEQTEWWKKLIFVLFTVPEYIGFIIWMIKDDQANRSIYLICQYFSFFSILVIEIYMLSKLLADRFSDMPKFLITDLWVTAISLTVFAIFGMLFLVGFQDYNSLLHVVENGSFDENAENQE